MNFAEIRFWLALAAGMLVVLIVCGLSSFFIRDESGRSVRDRCLLFLLGLGLLSVVGWVTTVVFIYVIIVTYSGTTLLIRGRIPPRVGIVLLTVLQLAPLLIFKYGSFISTDVLMLGNSLLHGLVIPVGVSFYTFQCMSFTWDTLRGQREAVKPMPGLLDFFNYAGFFPQIVAGPIERRTSLLPQMEKFRFRFSTSNFEEGTRWVVIGLFFKLCLGDNIATWSVAGIESVAAWEIWLQNIFFGLRIYFDFAGYSLTALGVGRWFGIRLTINFLSPYTRGSVTDFWRHWHVTLSQWFRDYLYLPMGGNKWTGGIVPVMVVFLVSGLWHGAGWNFLAWGGIHGVMLLIHRFCRNVSVPGVLSWVLTMAGVFFAWLFFYQTDGGVLMQNLKTLVTPEAYSLHQLKAVVQAYAGGDGLALAGVGFLIALTILFEWLGRIRYKDPYYFLGMYPVQILMVAATVVLAPAARNSFIYFAF